MRLNPFDPAKKIGTRITIVPCSDDYLHQIGGSAVVAVPRVQRIRAAVLDE